MACPKCGSEKIVSYHYYITKKYKKRNRWKCKDCGKTFLVLKHLSGVSVDVHRQIIQLSKKINPYAKKFDPRKEQTYSIREIAKILKVSHSTVERVLKKGKEEDKNGN